MDFLGEDDFNAVFGRRLMTTRTRMGLSRPQLAHSLGVTKEMLKRYETRSTAGFPLYLLPKLIFVTGKPYSYWTGTGRDHLTVVR